MSNYITIRLQDLQGEITTILDVPAEFSVSQILLDLIEGSELACTTEDKQRILRYYLKHKNNNKVLLPKDTLLQHRVLRGDIIFIYNKPALEVQRHSNIVAIRRRNPGFFEESSSLSEVTRLHAVGAYDQALTILLKLWAERNEQRTSNLATGNLAVMTANQLSNYIHELTLLYITEQLDMPDLDGLLEVITLPEFKVHYDLWSNYADDIIDALLELCQLLSKIENRYTDAYQAASLALRIDQQNEQAARFEIIAQAYVALLTSNDLEEKRICSNYLLQNSPDYGYVTRYAPRYADSY